MSAAILIMKTIFIMKIAAMSGGAKRRHSSGFNSQK